MSRLSPFFAFDPPLHTYAKAIVTKAGKSSIEESWKTVSELEIVS